MTEGSTKQATCDGKQSANRDMKDDRAALAGKAMTSALSPGHMSLHQTLYTHTFLLQGCTKPQPLYHSNIANHKLGDAGCDNTEQCRSMHTCSPDHSQVSAKESFQRHAAAVDAGDSTTD